MINKRLLTVIIICILGVLFFFAKDFFTQQTPIPDKTSNDTQSNKPIPENQVGVISTQPSPLEEATILMSQPVEITFNKPIENIGELKHRVEPEFAYDLKLSQDRKTVILSPKEFYPLGTLITLHISVETKFDGGFRLDSNLIYHFKTIKYRGV